MTIITLSNGKKVGNFSSPHPFEFEDGSILPAVSADEAERLKVDFHEQHVAGEELLLGKPGDMILTFTLSADLQHEMSKWMNLSDRKEVDVVFCPLPMITAIHGIFGRRWLLRTPFRAIRIEDRIKKLVSIHKQCV